MLDSDASTAKTLVLVAIVLQVIYFALGIIGIMFFLPVYYISQPPGGVSSSSTISITSTMSIFGLFLILILGAFLVSIMWILLDYFLIYKKLEQERVKETDTVSLILGILQLIFGGLIPGILLIIAHIKIRDSIEKSKYMNGNVMQ